MKTLYSILLITISTFSVNCFALNTEQAPLSIDLWQQGKTLNFSAPERLDTTILTAKANNLAIEYPLATTLFDESKQAQAEVSELKYSVLYSLIQQDLAAHPFYQFVQRQQFSKRVISSIDLDQIRLKDTKNPLLAGHFTLVAPKRNNKIWYIGNLNSVHSFRSLTGLSITDQQTQLKNMLGQEIQSPILIYPDGKVVESKMGYWLNEQFYLPPMTIVYVPFEHYATSDLDKNIVKLLTFLKMPQ
jgi:hypothetical protein